MAGFFRRREKRVHHEHVPVHRHGEHEHDLHHWEVQRKFEPITEPGEGRDFLFDVIIPGGIAGMVGGLVMLLLYMPLSLAFGAGFWTLPELISGVFYRDHYLPQLHGPVQIIVGLCLHFGIAGGLGTLWALMLPRWSQTMFAVIPLSIFYALTMYVVLNYFVAEWASTVYRREVIHPLWIVAHLGFAWSMALVPVLRRGYYTIIERTPYPFSSAVHP